MRLGVGCSIIFFFSTLSLWLTPTSSVPRQHFLCLGLFSCSLRPAFNPLPCSICSDCSLPEESLRLGCLEMLTGRGGADASFIYCRVIARWKGRGGTGHQTVFPLCHSSDYMVFVAPFSSLLARNILVLKTQKPRRPCSLRGLFPVTR